VALAIAMALAALATVALIADRAAAPARAASPPTLSFACSPEPADCSGWFREPVTLTWTWDPATSIPTGEGQCEPTTFEQDAVAVRAACEVTNGPLSTKLTVTIRVDTTPPEVTAAVPDRSPDFESWYTHPVLVAFQAVDRTSGLQGCDSVTHSGPEGAGVGVVGVCRDAAGNRASRTFPIDYDATPPGLGPVHAESGDGFAILQWRAAGDAARVAVRRSPGPATPIYNGTGTRFRDDSLRNGVAYRYTVSAYDQAGNATHSAVPAQPVAAPPILPAGVASVDEPPVLRWKPVKKARYYNVQLYRGGVKILSAWPRYNRFPLRKAWRYRDREQRLRDGAYRWYVWPGYGAVTKHRYGNLLVQKAFVMQGRR
jgi:hypothetical protein